MIVDVVPPEAHGHETIHTDEISLDAQAHLDCFETTFETLAPTVVHQVRVFEVRPHVQMELALDEGQIETATVVRIDLIAAFEAIEHSFDIDLLADELVDVRSRSAKARYTDDGQITTVPTQAGRFDVQIGV